MITEPPKVLALSVTEKETSHNAYVSLWLRSRSTARISAERIKRESRRFRAFPRMIYRAIQTFNDGSLNPLSLFAGSLCIINSARFVEESWLRKDNFAWVMLTIYGEISSLGSNDLRIADVSTRHNSWDACAFFHGGHHPGNNNSFNDYILSIHSRHYLEFVD